ncbi:MAG: phosphopyruvate hydratase [Parcubacteria group bacterium]|nr:phosphopyruvate hydratase [Parcubacteria group bacterium]
MYTIKHVVAREVLDSRGWPTVEAKVTLAGGASAVASVPSGASTGTFEAWELRDGGKRLQGKGVLRAVKNVNAVLAPMLKGLDARKLPSIDHAMIALDGTENKKKIGANAMLAVSLACAHAGARAAGLPLYRYLRRIYRIKETAFRFPRPMMNIVNGGQHANNTLSIQEFMVVPDGKTMAERVWRGVEVFQSLKKILAQAGYLTLVGDEGGFAPTVKDNEAALGYIIQAIRAAGFIPGKEISLASDLATSEFFAPGKGYDFDYKIKGQAGKKYLSAGEVVNMLASWIKKYHLISIEDPLNEESWEDWQMLTQKLGKQVQVVGDDLFVTNTKRLQKGIEMGVANAILIKVNQIGTLTETMEAIQLARKHGYNVIISHRSGDTGDTTIADLAVAVNAEYIKTGSLSRSERVEKYNRLMAIELELKKAW